MPTDPATTARPATVRVVVGVCTLAGAIIGVLATTTPSVSWIAVALIAGCVAAGEALRITLPYGEGQLARFGHGDVVIMAGLVLLEPTEVTLGAALGVLLLHVATRTDTLKSVFNIGQLTVSTAAAAGVFRLFVAEGTAMSPAVLVPYVAAAFVFMLVNTTLVGAVVATVTVGSVTSAVRRMLAPTAVLTAGGACLGLLALGLVQDHIYLIPVLGVPMVFLMTGSRQQVDAQLREERSAQLVRCERTLTRARSVSDIDATLIEGIRAVTNASSAIWRGNAWVTRAPLGSGPCHVALPHLGHAEATARTFGVPLDACAVAVAIDGGVVVAWGGDLGILNDTADWIQRLARSASEQVERTRAQAALLQERATLQAVVGGTSDGIYMLDADHTIRLANPAMATLANVAADDLYGQPAAVGFGQGDWASPGVRDVERRDAQGITVWRVAVAAISDSGVGDVLVGVVHDVSADRRLARMKDDMLAVVSHELRTPLTPIRAAAQLLRSRWQRLADEQRELLLDQLADRADHLTRLVEDLLLVAQMSSEDGHAPRPALAPVDVAAAVAADVAHQASTRAHEVVYDGPAELHALTDVRRLRQIVDNLIDNACKFSPASSPVLVRVGRHDDAVRITVTDQGRGIRPEDVARIFERFERVEDPLVMQTSGAGLGLYIVRSLVTALGGRLDVDSAVGRGTAMTVTLPLLVSSAAPPGSAAGAAPVAGGDAFDDLLQAPSGVAVADPGDRRCHRGESVGVVEEVQ